MPVMTTLQPAPDAVLYLVKCGCGKDKCGNNRCSCRRAGLMCTDLCSCGNSETGEACVNTIKNDSSDDETSDEQDDDSEEDEDDE